MTLHRSRPRRSVLAAAAALALIPLMAGPALACSHVERIGRNTIVFQSQRDGNDDLYSVDPDGSGLRRLTDDPAVDAAPSISPDRRSVAFARFAFEGAETSELHVLSVVDGTTRRLTNGEQFDFGPSYSHDGRRIVFQRRLADETFDLWVMDAKGRNARQLTTLPANEVGGRWSPDDRFIAFMGNNGGNRDIRVMRADGTGITNITQGWCTDVTAGETSCTPSEEVMAAWTPDGRIVFVSNRTGTNQLWIMKADGSRARPLTNLPGTVKLPAVSHNGKLISFSYDTHLATVRIDGTQLRLLTSSEDLTSAWPY